MNRITGVTSEIIKDSRGKETIRVSLASDGIVVNASVPSGISAGSSEAKIVEAKTALSHVSALTPEVKEQPLNNQEDFDEFLIRLDGTPDKSKLGGNTLLAFSLSYARLSARTVGLPLYRYLQNLSGVPELKPPRLYLNMIEGGVHDEAPEKPDFQEYLVVPQTNTVAESLKIGQKIYNRLEERFGREFLKQKSNEGGHMIKNSDNEEPLRLISRVVEEDRLKVKLAIDAAANSFFKGDHYEYNNQNLDAAGLLRVYEKLVADYDFLSIEDPFSEEDWSAFTDITKTLGGRVFIVGDDLTVTNPERIEKAAAQKSCSAVILKPNQIGTLSETLKAAKLAVSYNFKVIVSNRGRETMDDFIADLAWGVGAFALKSGAPYPQERMVKYDRMVRIEAEAMR